jgi:phosphopantothenoylcysteine decarboxylase
LPDPTSASSGVAPLTPATPAPSAASLHGPADRSAEVLVCVCGGIAAYKTAVIVSRLVQEGCGVTVVMTRNARRFIGRATFAALTGRPVHTDAWDAQELIQHLRLTEAADLALVAPATANIIGKLAGGIADDLASALLLGAACPVLLAPAMNTRMWAHPAVQRNIAFLREAGIMLIGPESGWQACRAVGPGRMSEPDAILAVVRELLQAARRPGGETAGSRVGRSDAPRHGE